MEYTIETDESGAPVAITCALCKHRTPDRNSIYFRWCSQCKSFLGPAVRRRWNGHREQLVELCQQFGRYKPVGRFQLRKVPTELILTEGIREEELHRFPLWREEDAREALEALVR
jgi:hypothetical protein